MSEASTQPGLPTIDVNEYGGKKDGVKQQMNRRLFMQLLVFRTRPGPHALSGGPHSAPESLGQELLDALRKRKTAGVVYADTMDPRGLALLTWSEDPSHFVKEVRPLFTESFMARVKLRHDYGMLGRTYATGHEPELEWTLLKRPIENVTNPSYPWHVWYPLRRKGTFAKLEPIEQSHTLREHAALGIAYGQAELAHDVRLACHGIDAGDNEFVIGLVGKDLHPLSHLVQAMRKTRQTSEFIEKMGPFFVGWVLGTSTGA
ncbi:MAG: chlorite dismutase family protein [Labilithrix sp.]|nr:chlorite dismutase family protein [Labilithrix sp.]MCW5815295.1 chlorite dismutase family protein [Labilithrix sp.]